MFGTVERDNGHTLREAGGRHVQSIFHLGAPVLCCAVKEMKRTGFRDYEATLEGELTHHCVGSVAHDIDRSQVRFMQVCK